MPYGRPTDDLRAGRGRAALGMPPRRAGDATAPPVDATAPALGMPPRPPVDATAPR